MLFPDQSPVVLIVGVIALLALALLAAGRDLLRLRASPDLACPQCGQAFDAQSWPRHNERAMYHGRYTVTPLYTCPKCGETVSQGSP
jgi:predicted RNA-binding Zn-ribbon protein involved in translation (DUF1610 family)